MVNDHCFRFLVLAPQSCIDLLIQFQGPGQTEPHQLVAAGLQVQSMTGGSRMDRTQRDFAGIPVLHILRGFQKADLGEALTDAGNIMLEPVGDQKRFPGQNAMLHGVPELMVGRALIRQPEADGGMKAGKELRRIGGNGMNQIDQQIGVELASFTMKEREAMLQIVQLMKQTKEERDGTQGK